MSSSCTRHSKLAADALLLAPSPWGEGAILHAAHTETLQRGEILTRSVSEEIGCEASLTLRVSVRNDRVEYSRCERCLAFSRATTRRTTKMKTMEADVGRSQPRNQDGLTEARHERWAHCHVNWTAVWIGALATFSMVVLFGLVGLAVGAHLLGPEHRIVDVKKLGLWTLIFSVCGAF